MSALLMGRVLTQADCAPMDYLLLVALADHGYDDGTRIFPSVAYLCWKTKLSERFIRKKLSFWRDMGVLIAVDGESRGRGLTVEYRLDVDALPRKEPFARPPEGAARHSARRSKGRRKGARDAGFAS